MDRRVSVGGQVKGVPPGAVAKASLNRANVSLGVDPKPGDLPMARMKCP